MFYWKFDALEHNEGLLLLLFVRSFGVVVGICPSNISISYRITSLHTKYVRERTLTNIKCEEKGEKDEKNFLSNFSKYLLKRNKNVDLMGDPRERERILRYIHVNADGV